MCDGVFVQHCKTEDIIPTIKVHSLYAKKTGLSLEEDLDEEDEGVHDVREELRRKVIKMEFTEVKTI